MKKLLLIILGGLLLAGTASAAVSSYGNFKERTILAAECGIFHYVGSRAQNIALEKCLQPKTAKGQLGYSVATGYQTSISSPMTNNQTTVPVSSFTLKDGHVLDITADLGGKAFFDIEPGSKKEEIVVCTSQITTTPIAWSGCTRGLQFSGSSLVPNPLIAYTHNPSSQIVMSNVHYVYEQFVDVNSKTQNVSGTKIFADPIFYASYATPTDSNTIISKAYADALTVPASYWTLSGGNIYRSTGNVGIGINSPIYPLDITGSNSNIATRIYNSLYSPSTGNKITLFTNSESANLSSSTYSIWAQNANLGNKTDYGYGLYSKNYVTGATTTNLYGAYLDNPSVSGSVTNNYGLYVPAFSGGTNNYAIYSGGPNTFNGITTINGLVTITATSTLATATISNLILPTTTPSLTTAPVSYYLLQNFGVTSSSNLKLSADTERTVASPNSSALKDFRIGYNGDLKVIFLYKGDSSGGQTSGTFVIRVNAQNTSCSYTSTLNTYATGTCDILVGAGDNIDLYVTGAGGYNAFTKNFKVYYDLAETTTSYIITD